jgi:hypothetical protein
MNHPYRVIGYDAEDSHLFVIDIDAPVRGIAEVMVLAELCRNFATSALVDKIERLVTRRAD